MAASSSFSLALVLTSSRILPCCQAASWAPRMVSTAKGVEAISSVIKAIALERRVRAASWQPTWGGSWFLPSPVGPVPAWRR